MKLARAFLVLVALGSTACTTFCLVGVRESAAVECEKEEAWETCLPKVEKHLDKAQAEALRLISAAAQGK